MGDDGRVRRRGETWRVSVPNVGALASLVVASIGEAPIRSLAVRVDAWRAPKGWVGAPGITGVTELGLAPRGAGAQVHLAVREPADPGQLLAGILRMLRPTIGGPGPLITLTPGLPASARMLAGSVRDVLVAEPEPNPHLRRTDTLLVRDPQVLAAVPRERTIVVREHGWEVDGRFHEVVVDPAVHRPTGRRSGAEPCTGTADVVDHALVIDAPGVQIRTREDLTAGEVYRLRAVTALQAHDLPTRWRAQLEACGIVIGGEVGGDALARDLASVHTRRHALRAYTPLAALNAWPTVSVMLVTHRADYLDHALAQIARMNYPRLQVAIGLHGVRVPDATFDALRSLHEVVVVELAADLPFGSALQAVSDRADGELLMKVDDDDYYASEHVWDLVLARMYSGAELVGKALDWIYVESQDVTAFRPVYPAESYATFVAGGTLCIAKADLAEAGGWRPVPKSVDRALIESVHRTGGLVYRTHGLGYVYVRHGSGPADRAAHTAQVDDAHFLTKNADQHAGLVAHEAFGTR